MLLSLLLSGEEYSLLSELIVNQMLMWKKTKLAEGRNMLGPT